MESIDQSFKQPNIINKPESSIKSASFLHILPFILLYLLKNHQPIEKKDCVTDKLYEYIPDKSTKFNPNMKYFLLAFPILTLLFKSNNNQTLEHTFVLLSYAIGLKTAMHFLSPCLPKQEFTNIVSITILLNLIYFNIIPKEHIQGGYIISLMYSLYLISMRETTSANIIIDYSLAHLSFLYTKMIH